MELQILTYIIICSVLDPDCQSNTHKKEAKDKLFPKDELMEASLSSD